MHEVRHRVSLDYHTFSDFTQHTKYFRILRSAKYMTVMERYVYAVRVWLHMTYSTSRKD